MLPCLVPVLFAFYLQGLLKYKCKIPAPKGYRSRKEEEPVNFWYRILNQVWYLNMKNGLLSQPCGNIQYRTNVSAGHNVSATRRVILNCTFLRKVGTHLTDRMTSEYRTAFLNLVLLVVPLCDWFICVAMLLLMKKKLYPHCWVVY